MTEDKHIVVVSKLEKLDARLDSLDTKLAVYNEQLKLHIKRTELLEKDVHPIKEHVQQVKGVTKFLTVCSILATIAVAVYNIIKV